MIQRHRFMMAIGVIALGAAVQSGGTPVTVCHRPPGNPSNSQTITVASAAVPAHLNHGDSLGACDISPKK